MTRIRRTDRLDITRRDLALLGAGGMAALTLPRQALGQDVTVSHGTSAFGDLKYPADFKHFDYANPDAPKGGYISTGYGPATFDSFNPFILKGTPAIGLIGSPSLGLVRVYDTLMTSAYDEADSLYSLIAESIELPSDRQFAVFNLNPNARFHDGTPITAEDVVFTFDILIEKGHPTYRTLLAPVEQAIAEDEGRVRFNFVQGAATRDLPALVAGISVLSKAYYTANDFTEANLNRPLGNGPYKIGKFDAGSYYVLERVKDYWAADLPVCKGRFNFDEVRIDLYRDRSAVLESLKSGNTMFTEEFYSKLWATGYDFEAVNKGYIVRDTIPDKRPAGSQGFFFNMRREKLQDPRVREAIALAFDFEWSNKRLFYGLYNRTDSFFEGGPMQADGPPTPGEIAILERFAGQLPEGILDQPAYVPPKTDGSGRLRRQLRKARQLLDAAGWKVVDGKAQKDGVQLELEILVGGPGFTRIATPYTQNLDKLGIKTSIREVDTTQYKRRTDEFDFDMTTNRLSMSQTPGVELHEYFSSKSAKAQGSQNLAGVADPVVDAMLDIIERATNRADLTDAVRALDRVLRAKHIWVPQWNKAAHNLAYWDMYQRPEIKPDYARGVFDLWWFDPDKEAKLKAAGAL